jgi:hypothetical protein
MIELLLEHVADSLRITIDDHGVWRSSNRVPTGAGQLDHEA